MSMNLTTDDLAAIKGIVGTAIEDAQLQTAAGFAEVDAKFAELREDIGDVKTDLQDVKTDLESVKTDLESVKTDLDSVKNSVGRIELMRRAEIERVDDHGQKIEILQQKLAGA